MKEERLLDAFGQIDEKFIEEADPEKKRESNRSKSKNKSAWIKWGAMAACAVAVVGITIPALNRDKGWTEGANEAGLEDCITEESAETEEGEAEECETEEGDTGIIDSLADLESAADTEPMQEIPIEKAQSIELFPTEMLDGYVLEGSVEVYDKKVVVARFYNTELDDTLTIRIYDKEYFYTQNDDVEFNSIIYQGESSSFIYFEGEKKIIRYKFSNSDIANHEGFFDMVYSADFFQNGNIPEIKEG